MRVCPICSNERIEVVCPDDGATTIEVHDNQPATLEAGTMIADRYRVDGVIGVGGFGAVYKCTQMNMNQTVAVKVLRSEHLTSVEHVKRFTREAQAVSKLKHPNTIRIFDFGTHSDGALFLAMEFVEGETLGHRLDMLHTIHWETLTHIIVQICHSLTEAHAAGLVHRDLKPENIMLLPVAGDPNYVKVLDFGIAKVQKVPGHPAENSLTESGMIMGTPTYMSPEQAKGEQIDRRCDIYALGVLLYEGLTGKPPFVGETPMKVLIAHIKDPPAPMLRDGSVPIVPAALERVVLECLEKDPAKRPQSTIALVDKLSTAIKLAREPEPTTASRAAIEPQATTTMGQLPTTALNAVGVPAPRREHTPPPAAPNRTPLWIGLGAFVVIGVGAIGAVAVGGKPQNAGEQTQVASAPRETGRAAPQEIPPVESKASQDLKAAALQAATVQGLEPKDALAQIEAKPNKAVLELAEQARKDRAAAEKATAENRALSKKMEEERAAQQKAEAIKLAKEKAEGEARATADAKAAAEAKAAADARAAAEAKRLRGVHAPDAAAKVEDKQTVEPKHRDPKPGDFRLPEDEPKHP